jgi:hypothetical protein
MNNPIYASLRARGAPEMSDQRGPSCQPTGVDTNQDGGERRFLLPPKVQEPPVVDDRHLSYPCRTGDTGVAVPGTLVGQPEESIDLLEWLEEVCGVIDSEIA